MKEKASSKLILQGNINENHIKDEFIINQGKVAEKITFDKKAYFCHLKVLIIIIFFFF